MFSEGSWFWVAAALLFFLAGNLHDFHFSSLRLFSKYLKSCIKSLHFKNTYSGFVSLTNREDIA